MSPAWGAPSSGVRHAEVDGLVVILDLTNEAYKILDDAGSAFWRVLTGAKSRDETFDGLRERYFVERETLTAEFDDFRGQCVRDGLLSEAVDVAPPASERSLRPPPVWLPSTAAALVCLTDTQRTLKRDGFRAAYRQASTARAGRRSGSLAQAAASFVAAENLFVARRAPDDCLVRSLSLFRFLKLFDMPVQHVIGVRRLPFGAHAWVECGGVAILDDNAHGFTPISRLT